MISEIKYGSYTASPSDYDNPDGDLALAIGAVCEDGSIKPIFKPSTVPNIKVPTGAVVLYVHTNVNYKNYIVKDGSEILSYDESGVVQKNALLTDVTYPIDSINSLGNTLLIMANGEIRYYLFKDGNYKYLGNHIPNIDISFGLRGEYKEMGHDNDLTFSVSLGSSMEGTTEFSEDDKTKVTTQVMAELAKSIAKISDKGKFCMPFFIRYALRLYDGTLVCHSAPILMNPATNEGPIVHVGFSDYNTLACYIIAMSCGIDYKAYSSQDFQVAMEDWKDIIKSVDVFVSKPIYLFDQSGKVERIIEQNETNTKFVGALDFDGYSNKFAERKMRLPITVNGTSMVEGDVDPSDDILPTTYTEWKYSDLVRMFGNKELLYKLRYSLELPTISDEDKRKSLEDNSLFYLLKSIPIKDMDNVERKLIEISEGYLPSLVSRESMKDDYLTHDRLSATYSHSYNNRMNLAGVSRTLFRGFSPLYMFANTTCNAPYVNINDSGVCSITSYPADEPISTELKATVFINENGTTYKVESDKSGPMAFFVNNYDFGNPLKSWGCYLFYPNPAAFKMIITDSQGTSFSVDLKEHDFLNGAYALLNYDTKRSSNYTLTSSDVPSSNISISMENRLYSSAVNNPFYYPSIGVISVGTGKILGISAAVEALSEGQFGQFPLYAFTTDGIWALEVASNGTYSAKQPISRDVCISPDSITQIDKSVMFATNRGIMVISGSSTQCISDSLTSQQPFTLIDLPRYQGLLSVYNSLTTDVPISAESMKLIPFEQFLSSCKMLFDYTHQRVFVYNPAVKYSYVFSLKSKTWGLSMSYITSNVNSYPEALAMQTTTTASGETTSLVDFSKFSSTEAPIMIVTRPFRLTSGDLMKTIRTIIQRGMINKNSVKQILYGSNDLYHWFPIWSSSDIYLRGFGGTSYKAFRLAVVGCLNQSQSISGCSVDYDIKLNNKLR